MKKEASESDADVPKGWHRMPLGQVVTFQRGYDLPLKEKKEGNYPIVASNGIIGYHNQSKAKGPGVTVGRSGNLGKPFFVEEDYWPHNTTLYVTEFHNSDPSFIYYFLKTLNLSAFNAGSAVPTLNRNHIHTLQVVVPMEMQEQRYIANILSKLDKRIKLNCDMNATFEAIGQAIFKHWFVDFEFPNEEGNPYKSNDGRMVSSELGRIPKGWEVKRLGEITEAIFSGGTPDTRNNEYWNGSYPWLSSGETASHFIFRTEKKITQKGVDNSSTRIARIGDIVVASAGQGKTRGQTSLCFIDSYINQSIVALRTKKSIVPSSYLFFSLSRRYPELRALSDSHSIRGSLTTRIFKDLRIVFPPLKTLSTFDSLLTPTLKKIHSNLIESETLSGIRDSLLPKLMSGKIRVSFQKESVEANDV